VLTRLGYTPALEAPLLDGLLVADILVEGDAPGGAAAREAAAAAAVLGVAEVPEGVVEGGRRLRVAVEFDGPLHFLGGRADADATGALTIHGRTLMRSRMLHRAGVAVVAVPHTEWRALSPGAEQDAYVARRMREVVGGGGGGGGVPLGHPGYRTLQG
jgi:hypothetical protein